MDILDLTDISRGVDFGADLGVVLLDVIAATNNPAAVFFLCFLFRFLKGMLCVLISLCLFCRGYNNNRRKNKKVDLSKIRRVQSQGANPDPTSVRLRDKRELNPTSQNSE